MPIIAENGLPNYLREQLIQAGHESLARVYDALIMLEWGTERVFSEAEALDALKPLSVGRRALRDALAGHGFIQLAQRRATGGRPAQLYQARSLADLQRQFYIVPDVQPSQRSRHAALQSDPIQASDLAHGRYRRALHYAVIWRRQGLETTRRWLAARLNVCARTLRRWEKALKIRAEHRYERLVLTLGRVAELPDELGDKRPIWLESGGKRYRATKHTAEYLLHQTIDALLVRQLPNCYFL